jgi:FlaA1/EpsC-like NDP-sugar epimerase
MGYIKAITIGTIMAILIILFFYRFMSFSRAVFVIYWVLLLIFVSISRLSFRILDEGIKKGVKNGIPVLVYGAGMGGQMTLKEIETNMDLGLALVGFIDDNKNLHGRKIKGYPVFGGQEELKKIIDQYGVKEIIVSFKEKSDEKRREINSLCSKMGVELDVLQMKLIIS